MYIDPKQFFKQGPVQVIGSTHSVAQEIQPQPNYFQKVGQAAKSSFNSAVSGMNEIGDAKNLGQFFEGIGKTGSGIVNTVFSPLAPPVEATLGKAINYAGDKISNNPSIQKFASSNAGELASRLTENLANYNNIAGAVAGSEGLMKVGTKATTALGEAANTVGEGLKTIGENSKNFTGDIIPSTDRIVNHQVTKALDLTAGDVKNISMSTGNEVGRFLADQNLIGVNKASTLENVKTFFKQNYETVRGEINKVQNTYKPSQVPRYVEALKAIQKKVDGTPGLQEASVEIENLLNKKEIKLADVQRVKELIDEHFNLYKSTGDVGEGVAKQGLDNIRKDMKGFIENEVKKNTGADIGQLNNNVATSKGIMDAVEARSTAGLTRGNLKLGDFGAFGLGMSFGGPLGGVAALFMKKLAESPAVQLRIAKFLDGISDAAKARIKADLESGQIPPEFNQFIRTKNGSKGFGGPGAMNLDFTNPKIAQLEETWQRIQEAKLKTTDKNSVANYEQAQQKIQNQIKNIQRYTKGKDGKFTGSSSNIE